MDKIESAAENVKQLLLYFYPPYHPYIQNINRVLGCSDPKSKEFSEAIRQSK